MPTEAKRSVLIVTGVAVFGLLLNIVGAAIIHGRNLGALETGKASSEQIMDLRREIDGKAGRDELLRVVETSAAWQASYERRLAEYREHSALLEGEIQESLRGIRADLVEIKAGMK